MADEVMPKADPEQSMRVRGSATNDYRSRYEEIELEKWAEDTGEASEAHSDITKYGLHI